MKKKRSLPPHDTLKIVRFIFAARRNPLSPSCFLLKWFEKIPFSHCAIEIDGFVYEAVFPKSKTTLFVEWSKTYDIVAEKLVFAESSKVEKIKTYMRRSLMNKGYSIMQLAVLFWALTFHGFNAWAGKHKWNGSKYLICTELVATVAHKYFGVEFGEKLDTISLTEAFVGVCRIDGVL